MSNHGWYCLQTDENERPTAADIMERGMEVRGLASYAYPAAERFVEECDDSDNEDGLVNVWVLGPDGNVRSFEVRVETVRSYDAVDRNLNNG